MGSKYVLEINHLFNLCIQLNVDYDSVSHITGLISFSSLQDWNQKREMSFAKEWLHFIETNYICG